MGPKWDSEPLRAETTGTIGPEAGPEVGPEAGPAADSEADPAADSGADRQRMRRS